MKSLTAPIQFANIEPKHPKRAHTTTHFVWTVNNALIALSFGASHHRSHLLGSRQSNSVAGLCTLLECMSVLSPMLAVFYYCVIYLERRLPERDLIRVPNISRTRYIEWGWFVFADFSYSHYGINNSGKHFDLWYASTGLRKRPFDCSPTSYLGDNS